MDITSELTIVIPVRMDSKEREENLRSILSYLISYTSATILIMEVDEEQKFFLKNTDKRIKYYFKKDTDVIFHHTRYRNELLIRSETNIIAIWDADVFLTVSQLKAGIEWVKKGVTRCIPYDGRAFYLSPEDSINARKNLYRYINNCEEESLIPLLGRPSVGGVFIINKQRYLQAGGENENIYGWGPEDAERVKRMEILEEPVERGSGPLFHLYHPRGINSTFGYDERDRNNLKELIKVCKMNTEELRKYIQTWK
ncbi:galactosyltransferase-related protein [Tannerella forsythia]